MKESYLYRGKTLFCVFIHGQITKWHTSLALLCKKYYNGFIYYLTMTKGISWHYLLLNFDTGGFFYGHTSEHRKDKRHDDPEYSKIRAEWQLEGYKFKTFWYEIPKVGHHLDKPIHKKMDHCQLLKPNPNRGSNEYFQLLDPEKWRELRVVIEEYVKEEFGADAKRERKVLTLKKCQELFRKKIKSKKRNFLLAAKMRSGKVVMTAMKIVDDNIIYSLIISRRNSPEQSWREDIEKFDKFENLHYIRLGENGWKKDLEKNVKLGKQIIFYTTAQYLINRLNVLDDYKIEFLAFDEVHVGGKANEVVKIRDHFSDAQQLDISGTAFDFIPDYTPENRFIWTYFDEKNHCEVEGLPYSKLNVVVAKYDDSFKKYHPEAPDSITNLFSLNDDGNDFRSPALVTAFINKILVTGKNPAILPDDETLSRSNHIYAALPSVAACDLFAKYIEKTECVYKPLSCHGSSNKSSDDINGHLERYTHTICLTVSANVLGVTAKWDTIMFLNTGESLSQWLQMAFRASSNPNKDSLVIDFAAERALYKMREYYNETAVDGETDTEITWLKSINVLGFNTGFEPLDISEIDNLMTVDIKSVTQVCSGVHINNNQLLKFDVNEKGALVRREYEYYETNANGTNQKSAKKITNKSVQKTTKKELQKKRDSIRHVLRRFPKLILTEHLNGNRVTNLNTLLSSSNFDDIIGEEASYVQSIFDENIINTNTMNTAIADTDTSIANNLNDNLLKALEFVSIYDAVHRPIPEKCLHGMMNETSVF